VRHELTFAYDYGQVYLYDAGAGPGDVIAALDDANAARLTVGVDGGLVDLLMPMQWNFDAPLVVELLDAAPALDLEGWEHVVEFPLALPTGRLTLEGLGRRRHERDAGPGLGVPGALVGPRLSGARGLRAG
jgi:hypothetical protein